MFKLHSATCYNVRTMQSSSEELVLAVSNDNVSVCEVKEAGQLKVCLNKLHGLVNATASEWVHACSGTRPG